MASGILYEIYDAATKQPIAWKKEINGTISDCVSGDIDENHGWKRIKMPLEEWQAHEATVLKNLESLKKFWLS